MSVFLHFSCLRSTSIRSFASRRPLSCSSITSYGEAKPSKKIRKTEETSLTENSSRNILVETKLQDYLDYIAKTQDISIVDLEREYKPSMRPEKTAPDYEQEYNKVIARLVRSFSHTQLRTIAKLYELDIPSKTPKWPIATEIVERKWRWPSLTGIKQEKRDSEIIRESFLLDAKQAFLVLGKDGADLLDISSKFGVHVSFSSSPLSLKVEGSRASLGQLGTYIDNFKMGIKEQYFQLPAGRHVGADSLQHISRKSGVFTEDTGDGLIRLTFKDGDEAAAHFAERLTFRAASEVEEFIPTLINPASEPTPGQVLSSRPMYSFYPFQPTQLKLQASKQASLFRVRRIEDWLRSHTNNGDEDEVQDAGHVMDFSGEPVDLRHALLAQVPVLQAKHRITASFGHLLVSSNSSESNITPPLAGSHELSHLLKWFRTEEPKTVFVSSLPRPLINCAPAQQHLIHRLVYRSLPTSNDSDSDSIEESLKFEVILDHTNLPRPKNLEVNDDNGHSDRPEDLFTESVDPPDEVALSSTCSTESSCRLDLMLPDRPMDIRFSVSTNHNIAREFWPASLENYYGDLSSFLTTSGQATGQPEIPLTIMKDGVDYQLNSSSTVRQTLDPNLDVFPLSPEPSLSTVVESILELETNERSRLCQVTCDDITSDVSWEAFLRHCYALVAPLPSAQKSPRLNF